MRALFTSLILTLLNLFFYLILVDYFFALFIIMGTLFLFDIYLIGKLIILDLKENNWEEFSKIKSDVKEIKDKI